MYAGVKAYYGNTFLKRTRKIINIMQIVIYLFYLLVGQVSLHACKLITH